MSAAFAERLAAHAATSSALTDVLAGFGGLLSRLEEAILPVQTRSEQLSAADARLAAASSSVTSLLAQLDGAKAAEKRLGAAALPSDATRWLSDVRAVVAHVASLSDARERGVRAAEGAAAAAAALLSSAGAKAGERLTTELDAATAAATAAAAAATAASDAALDGGKKRRGGRRDDAPPNELPLPPPLPEESLPSLRALCDGLHAAGCGGDAARRVASSRGGALGEALSAAGLDRLRLANQEKQSQQSPKLGVSEQLAGVPGEALGEKALLWGRLLRCAVSSLAADCAPGGALSQLLPEPDVAAAAGVVASCDAFEVLLRFGDALSTTPPSASRLFACLDAHAAAASASPALRALLPRSHAAPPRLEAVAASCGALASACFADVVPSIGRDDKRPAPQDGGIHPCVAAGMRALRTLYDDHYGPRFELLVAGSSASSSKQSRRRAEQSASSADASGSSQPPSPEAASAVASAARSVVSSLSALIASRAAALRSAPPGLGDLFSLNNGAFVALQAASSPQLAAALGGRAFLEAAQAEAESRLRSVVGATWGAAASLLGDGARSGLVPSRLSAKERETVKDRFRAFNECFEAAAPALPKWAAPDAALRSRLKEELGDAVLKPYGELFAAFADSGFTKFRERYVKHHPEEAARVFESFFEGLQ